MIATLSYITKLNKFIYKIITIIKIYKNKFIKNYLKKKKPAPDNVPSSIMSHLPFKKKKKKIKISLILSYSVYCKKQ